jgi:RHS repeat-associated protein
MVSADPMADWLGSVTSLSNSSGALANTYAYDSFGKVTASTSTVTNPLQYTAREFDTETNLNYYRARYYDPQIGRFIAEDAIRFHSGVNFYGYVSNNPTLFVDPSGNCLDIQDFVDWVDAHSTDHYDPQKNGHCALHIRSGLQDAGINTSNHPTGAKDYGPYLTKWGFSSVSQEGYTAETGDIVVVQPASPQGSGHIESWDGSQWVSDYKQGSKKISPYSTSTPYAIYRSTDQCP